MNQDAIGAGWLLAALDRFPFAGYGLLAALLVVAVLGVVALSLSRAARERDSRTERRVVAERELELRRETYLPAAEALAHAQEFIAKYPQLELDREASRVLVDHLAGALGRVQLVGSERVLKACSAASSEFTNAFLSLTAKRRPLAELSEEIEHLDQRVAQLGYERDQLLGNLTRMAGDSVDDAGSMWTDANLRFDRLHREVSAALDQRRERQKERARLRRTLDKDAAQHALRLLKLAVPAYLAMRRELELPLDEEEYRAIAQQQIRNLERQIEKLGPRRQGEAERRAAAPAKPAAASPETRLKVALRNSG